MKVIALVQAYNEAQFVDAFFQNRYPHMDQIIITEGSLTPFGNMQMRSPDGTRERIQYWIDTYDSQGKCKLLQPLTDIPGATREAQEGFNKNYMLQNADIEPGDIIHVGDLDEFYDHDGIDWILQQFSKNDKLRQCWPEEWQFAYNLHLAFKARHGSRFLRFIHGSHFGKTNHFFHGDFDLVKDKSFIVPRSRSGVCHLAFAKHPGFIREKVISFNRRSFTSWYNNVYLRWPGGIQLKTRGYAEGQSAPLQLYHDVLPKELQNLSIDYFDEIRFNWAKYTI